MSETILNQLNEYFDQEEHHKIIEIVSNLPKKDLSYELINHLGRAYNNIEEYDKAIDVLSTVSERGEKEALWNFRIGYAFFHKEEDETAILYFKKSIELGNDTAQVFIDTIKAENTST